MKFMQLADSIPGIIFGTLFSVFTGMVYILVLHEPGSLFYPFAAMFFLGGPLLAGTSGAVRSPAHRYRASLAAGFTVFCITLVLFFMSYAVLPQSDRTSVHLP